MNKLKLIGGLLFANSGIALGIMNGMEEYFYLEMIC